MIKYPASIDTSLELPTVIDNVTPINGALLNNMRDAILALENELGIKPSGIYTNVRTRIAATEVAVGNLQIISLAKDLGGTLALPLIIGLQGTPVSSTIPTTNQALVFNGIRWAPATLASGSFAFTASGDLSGTELIQTVIGLQGRALTSTAPSDGYTIVWDAGGSTWKPGAIIGFTAGGDLSGTSTSQTVIRLQNIPVNATVPTDGQLLTYDLVDGYWHPADAPISFTAGGDLTGTASNQTVAKIKGTTITTAGGSLPVGAVLRTTAAGTADWGAVNLADADAVTGSLPITNFAAGIDGYILSTVAGVPTWTHQLPARYELTLASGLFSTTSSTFTRSGGRQIDMSVFPATIGALTRSVIFSADIDITTGATTVEVQLYDITHSVAVTSTDLTSSSTTNTRVVSSALTVGSSAGNIRSDVATQYELQFKMNGGGGSDAVFLTNSRLVITYA
jgi:hypothetical protein